MSNQIFPVIGAQDVTIVSPIPVPTQDQSDGTPGQPVPLTALQIAGSDGTDLQAVSTDTSGNVNVNVVNTPTIKVEGTVTVAVVGTSTVVVAGSVTLAETPTVAISGTATVEVAGIAGTPTVEVAGILGTSTVSVAGIVQVAPTGSANTRINPFFTEITDGASTMGVMANFGSNPGAVPALNANVAVQQGTVQIAGTPSVTVLGTVAVSGTFAAPTGTQTVVVAGTSTVSVAGTPTVAISGTVAVTGTFAAPTGTQTVVVAGTTTVEVAGIVGTPTVEVAGILGTSTVTVAGSIAAIVTGTQTVEVAGILGTSTVQVAGISAGTVAIAGTSTVEVAGIVGTSTVTIAGSVAAVVTGTQTVQVAGIVGTPTVEVAGILGGTIAVAGTSTVEVAGIVGTSTVALAGVVGPVAPGTAAASSILVGSVVATSAAVGTVGQQMAVQMDVAGCIRVNPAGQTGSFKAVTGTATGGAAIITVPAGKKWLVKSIAYLIATSSTVATRSGFEVFVTDGTNALAFVATPSGVSAGASTTNRVTYGPSLPLATAFTSSNATAPFPEVALGPSFTIEAAILTNQEAGDVSTLYVNVIEHND